MLCVHTLPGADRLIAAEEPRKTLPAEASPGVAATCTRSGAHRAQAAATTAVLDRRCAQA